MRLPRLVAIPSLTSYRARQGNLTGGLRLHLHLPTLPTYCFIPGQHLRRKQNTNITSNNPPIPSSLLDCAQPFEPRPSPALMPAIFITKKT